MQTNFISASRLWVFAGAPDSSVHNSEDVYADVGEYFFNTSNTTIYLCTVGGLSQTWIQIAFYPQVQSAISAIPQANWTQANSSASDYIKNKPTINTRSQSSASRTLNSAFQISSTRDTLANYSVDIATTLSLTTGQSGTVFLEIASDSGFTTNVQELARFVNGNTGTLTIGLSLSQNVTGTLSGYIPAAYYARLRTANNTGTPTFTYRSGQEVLL